MSLLNPHPAAGAAASAAGGTWTDEQFQRGRKRTRGPPTKRIRKERITYGRQYTTTAKKQRPARRMRENPCLGKKCGLGCAAWSRASRDRVFEGYWNLGDHQRQRDWVASHVRKTKKGRKRTSVDKSRRQWSYQYFLEQDGKLQRVCKQFFLATLDLGQHVAYHTMGNVEPSMGTAKRDQTGKCTSIMRISFPFNQIIVSGNPRVRYDWVPVTIVCTLM